MAPQSVFDGLTGEALEKIRSRARERQFPAGTRVFSEGDSADHIYFVQSGRISIVAAGSGEIRSFGRGDCFGEMAVFFSDRRTASAVVAEDAALLCVTTHDFLDLMGDDPAIAHKVNQLLAERERELILREKLIAATGIDAKSLRVAVKGDAATDDAAGSGAVDRMLPELLPRLEALLLERCAFQLFISFNSADVIVRSVLTPFSDEAHPVEKLLDEAYLDRHFPPIAYERKAGLIRDIYATLRQHDLFTELPPSLQGVFGEHYREWRPLPQAVVARTISRLPALRELPNFHLRNCTIGIVTDAIHMQFNCDGTHTVSAGEFERFLGERL